MSLHATLVRSDPGRSPGPEPADRRRAGVQDRHLYTEPTGIKQDDFVDRLRMWMRFHARLSIELVFANHALASVLRSGVSLILCPTEYSCCAIAGLRKDCGAAPGQHRTPDLLRLETDSGALAVPSLLHLVADLLTLVEIADP